MFGDLGADDPDVDADKDDDEDDDEGNNNDCCWFLLRYWYCFSFFNLLRNTDLRSSIVCCCF